MYCAECGSKIKGPGFVVPEYAERVCGMCVFAPHSGMPKPEFSVPLPVVETDERFMPEWIEFGIHQLEGMLYAEAMMDRHTHED